MAWPTDEDPVPTAEDKKPAGTPSSKYLDAAKWNTYIRDRFAAARTTFLSIIASIVALTNRVTALESASGVSAGAIWIGDGSDGNVVLDGVATVLGMAPATVGGYKVYTMTRHIFALNLTFSATNVRLHTNGWTPHVQETLTPFADGTSRVSSNGGSAVAQTGGVAAINAVTGGPLRNGASPAGGNASVSLAGGPTAGGDSGFAPAVLTAGSAAGGTGSAGNGNNGANGAIGQGGGGGQGGGSSGSSGAPGGTVTLHASLRDIREGLNAILGTPAPGSQGYTGPTGGGGGRGGNDGAGNSNWGGGGGAPGGYLVLIAKRIADANLLTVESNGGNGANAVAGFSGGGGGGGSGGLCVVGVGEGSHPNMTATGGTGGNGATGSVSGISGGNGGNGGAGWIRPMQLG